jgi:CRP-like cAMP-binding protein
MGTLLATRRAGDIVGEMAAIDGEPRSAQVSALTPLHVRIVAAPEFNAFLDANPRVLRVLLVMCNARLRDADHKRAEHRGLDVPRRIARRLLELSETDGLATRDGIVLELLTQQELAEWVGASREAVAKAFRLLRERGAVETRRLGITILQPELLRRLAFPPGSETDPLL